MNLCHTKACFMSETLCGFGLSNSFNYSISCVAEGEWRKNGKWQMGELCTCNNRSSNSSLCRALDLPQTYRKTERRRHVSRHPGTPGQAHLAFSLCVVGAPAYVNIFYVLFHTLPVTAQHWRLRCHPALALTPLGHHLGGQGATLRRVAAALCGKCKFY